jgi:pyruvate,water dikinase
MENSRNLVCDFEFLVRSDGALVGGKNSSLGEMISSLGSEGITVPPGFATTSHAYWYFVDANGIQDKIAAWITEWQSGKLSLAETGQALRNLFLHGMQLQPLRRLTTSSRLRQELRT